MKRNMKLVVAVLAAAGVGAGTTAIAAEQMGVSKNEIVVGTIQDLSGPLAGFGKALRFGMQMRVDEVNEAGGINGRKVELVSLDDRNDRKAAGANAEKLVNGNGAVALFGFASATLSLDAMPVVKERKVPFFGS